MTNTTEPLCGDECFTQDFSTEIGRREFGAMALGAGVVLATGTASAAVAVKENEVTITTPDGIADGYFVHPTSGPSPGVLIWTDIMGLRPAFRDMAKRLAGEGYAVLCPNPYYRTSKMPVFPADFDFMKPEGRAQAMAAYGPLHAPGCQERDATAYIAWLDTQSAVKKTAKIGTTGYCMGGPLTMITAAVMADRVGAAGSFHGGGLASDKPDSPHLLIPKMKARYLVAIADNDDKTQPTAKDTLKAAFAAAKLPAEIEVYEGANHGWCVPGTQVYNPPQAEKAWGKLLTLFKTTLT